MKQYDVTGMSCAACSARVEKAVNGVEGVTACAVSLLTNSMGVEGDASPEKIIAAVEAAGYGCKEKGAAKKTVDHAVHGHVLPGPHHEHVAGGHVLDGHLDLLPVSHHHGGLGG